MLLNIVFAVARRSDRWWTVIAVEEIKNEEILTCVTVVLRTWVTD